METFLIPIPLNPKFCKHCDKEKKIMDFYRMKDTQCKECYNAKKKAAYRKKNPNFGKSTRRFDRLNMEY